MRLAAGNGSYLIHGTNNPTAVGMAVTHGCIRMYPEDVAAVFAAGAGGHQGAPDQRAGEGRLGRAGNCSSRRTRRWMTKASPPSRTCKLLSKMLTQALGNNTAAINWDLARAALETATGMPTLVGLAAQHDEPVAAAVGAARQAPRDARFSMASSRKTSGRRRVRNHDPRVGTRQGTAMLHYAVVFFIIALVAGVLGFGGIAAGAAGIAKILFFIFLILAVITFLRRT